MNFTGLEAFLMAAVFGIISSALTQAWMRRDYVRKEECVGLQINRHLERIDALLRVMAGRLGIPPEEQLEIEAQAGGRK